MQFAIVCLDQPDHGHLRAENRPAHIDYLNANLEHVLLAGPFLSEDGERPVGSLPIMEFDDRGQARAFAEGDRGGPRESGSCDRWDPDLYEEDL